MFSFLIPNYNNDELLQDCINSIKNLISFDLSVCEIIIIDNSDIEISLDNLNYRGVKYIRNRKNLGFGAAVNMGIKTSKNKYIVILNNDIVLERDWLIKVNEFINKNKNYDLYSTTIMQKSNNNLIDSIGFNLTKGFGIITKRNLTLDEIDQDYSVFGPVAACAIYKREIFFKIGLFFEKYFLYEEDIDIAIRAQLYGYRCGHINNAKSTHIGSASLGIYSPVKQYFVSRNKIWLFYLNMHGNFILKSITFFIFHQIFIIMKSISYFNLLSHLNGVIDGLKELNKLSSVKKSRKGKVRISSDEFHDSLSKMNLIGKFLEQ